MKNRKHNEIIDEAIKLLSDGEYTLTQFMSKLNINHIRAKKIINNLIQKGLIQTITKKSKIGNQFRTHYRLSTVKVKKHGL